ncbi:mandelate racemase/muconate lactonizing enzyme family protein [Elioraea sp.]|uniref:mandelate racemase/muconate lactonizing enzyme family protein n=1 Tax=Elioraea sp. TaxID=2185103 RepID=UPI0025BAFB67|nr:enolase C-terminal domain-like protein [Elioraea sp.]
MRITGVRTVVVWGPRRLAYGGSYRTALGASAVSEHAIVFVETDVGLTGIGEASSVFRRRGRLLARDIDAAIAPAVIGEDPTRIRHLAERIEASIDGAEEAKAAVEMALWDITGKHLGVPVYALLGGKVRDRVPLSYSVPFGEPDQMAAFAAERVRAGHRTIKVKIGNAHARDIAAVAAVRAAIGPDVKLRVDANMALPTAKDAIRLVAAIDRYDIELFEQPLAPRALSAMAEVRRGIAPPLMADESIRTPGDAMDVIRHGAADIANVYVSEAGGLLAASKIFTLCEAAGLPCMIGSMPEFGIGTAAQIHLGVAMTNLGPDSDTCGSLYHAEDLLVTPLRIEDGFAYPPEAPGLGVEIDMRVLERWQQAAPGDVS